MNKDIIYKGIDVPKDVFDLTYSSGNYFQFENDINGFKNFVKLLGKRVIV